MSCTYRGRMQMDKHWMQINTQIKAPSITSMQKTSNDCPGCKSALKFDTTTYTCSSKEEGKYAMYNGYIYVSTTIIGKAQI